MLDRTHGPATLELPLNDRAQARLQWVASTTSCRRFDFDRFGRKWFSIIRAKWCPGDGRKLSGQAKEEQRDKQERSSVCVQFERVSAAAQDATNTFFACSCRFPFSSVKFALLNLKQTGNVNEHL